MQRSRRRMSVGFVVTGLLTTLLTVLPSETANADTSWSSTAIGSYRPVLAATPSGNVTVASSEPQPAARDWRVFNVSLLSKLQIA
jgi:hypothetical protein